MKLLKFQRTFGFFAKFEFGIFMLGIIALLSSVGSFIEQDESLEFYQENYSLTQPIYGFITWKSILFFGLDHIYTTWWFLSLLIILGISLISCTIIRQFPLVSNSKEYFFRKKKNSFTPLPFSIKFQNIYFLKESILLQIQNLNFHLYQTRNLIYGYKGLIGRISPILVHISLILILLGAGLGAFQNFKAQEILPKGELFHIQNPIKIGSLTSIPNLSVRVNDFWVEYENKRVHQFYSNLSVLDPIGNEKKELTISVNHPLRYQNVDFYQSDWNLLGIRIQNVKEQEQEQKIYEYPLFSTNQGQANKSWITWIANQKNEYALIFNSLDHTFLVYDQTGKYLGIKNVGETIQDEFRVLDIIPSTGLLIKYDPSIPFIYGGFGLLILTTLFSYLPYTQIWVYQQSSNNWIGCLTNRGKIQLEIEFENLIRKIENKLVKNNLKTS
jgi:cytochrome c biogenesis protein